MATYFHNLASHAAADRIAVVDPVSKTRPAESHSYSQLLARIAIFRERLVTVAAQGQKELFGARIGLLAPPGLDFVAALLSIWSVNAIVGKKACEFWFGAVSDPQHLVPICSSHPPLETAHTVTDSDQDFILYHSRFRSKIQPFRAKRLCIDIADVPVEAAPQKVRAFDGLSLEPV
jgi:acyl-CoA synthetase (AMP-forming)/AMP-acid ligase II